MPPKTPPPSGTSPLLIGLILDHENLSVPKPKTGPFERILEKRSDGRVKCPTNQAAITFIHTHTGPDGFEYPEITVDTMVPFNPDDPLAYRDRAHFVPETDAHAATLEAWITGTGLPVSEILTALERYKNQSALYRTTGVPAHPYTDVYFPLNPTAIAMIERFAVNDIRYLSESVVPYCIMYGSYTPPSDESSEEDLAYLRALNNCVATLAGCLATIAHLGKVPMAEDVKLYSFLRELAMINALVPFDSTLQDLSHRCFKGNPYPFEEQLKTRGTIKCISRKLMAYHILTGIYRLLQHGEKDPRCKADRLWAHDALLRRIECAPRVLISFPEGLLRLEVETDVVTLPLLDGIFRLADTYFSERAVAVRPVETQEKIFPVENFNIIHTFAYAHFKAVGCRRQTERKIREKQSAIARMQANCDEKATVVPQEVSGTVPLGGKTSCTALKRLWIGRSNPGGAIAISNSACTGSLDFMHCKKTYRLPWSMDAHGALSLEIGAERCGPSRFHQPTLLNFYLEIVSLIFSGLQGLLVRQEAEESSGDHRPSITTHGANSKENLSIRARMDAPHIIVIDDKTAPPPPDVHKPNAGLAQQVANLNAAIAKSARREPVSTEEIAGLILCVKQEFTTPTGEPDSIFVPVETGPTIVALARGTLTKEMVFVCLTPGHIQRAGYQPWRKKDARETIYLTKRESHSDSDARLTRLEELLGIRLSRTAHRDRLDIKVDDPVVEKVIIGTRSEIDAATAPEILVSDLRAMTDGTNELISPVIAAKNLPGDAVQAELAVPQSALFNQGTFVSVAEAERILNLS